MARDHRATLDQIVMQWREIATGYPPFFESVLIATTSERFPIRMAWRGKRFEGDAVGAWYGGAVGQQCDAILDREVTHWMPLPPLPVMHHR